MALLRSSCVLATVLVVCVFGCSEPEGGYKEPTKVESIQYVDSVLYGHVLETYPHPFESTAYTALLQVYCVLKGHVTPSTVNVSRAGFMPGLCSGTELEEGNEYVALLGYDAETVQYTARGSYPHTDLQEIATICNLIRSYPTGISNSTYPGKACPRGVDADSCVSSAPHLISISQQLMFFGAFFVGGVKFVW